MADISIAFARLAVDHSQHKRKPDIDCLPQPKLLGVGFEELNEQCLFIFGVSECPLPGSNQVNPKKIETKPISDTVSKRIVPGLSG